MKIKQPNYLSMESQRGKLTYAGAIVYQRYIKEFFESGIVSTPEDVKTFCCLCNGFMIWKQSKDVQDDKVRAMGDRMLQTIQEKAAAMGILLNGKGMTVDKMEISSSI